MSRTDRAVRSCNRRSNGRRFEPQRFRREERRADRRDIDSRRRLVTDPTRTARPPSVSAAPASGAARRKAAVTSGIAAERVTCTRRLRRSSRRRPTRERSRPAGRRRTQACSPRELGVHVLPAPHASPTAGSRRRPGPPTKGDGRASPTNAHEPTSRIEHEHTGGGRYRHNRRSTDEAKCFALRSECDGGAAPSNGTSRAREVPEGARDDRRSSRCAGRPCRRDVPQRRRDDHARNDHDTAASVRDVDCDPPGPPVGHWSRPSAPRVNLRTRTCRLTCSCDRCSDRRPDRARRGPDRAVPAHPAARRC